MPKNLEPVVDEEVVLANSESVVMSASVDNLPHPASAWVEFRDLYLSNWHATWCAHVDGLQHFSRALPERFHHVRMRAGAAGLVLTAGR